MNLKVVFILVLNAVINGVRTKKNLYIYQFIYLTYCIYDINYQGENKIMNKLLKKSAVILICLAFSLSVYSASAITIPYSAPVEYEDEEVDVSDDVIEQVELLRYGPDGTVTPVTVDIILEDGQDIDEAIADKCEEMTDEDMEIQNFINGSGNNNTTTNKTFKTLQKVKSRGRGFHFKMKRQLSIKKKLISLRLPKVHTWIPFIYCDYSNDPRANTTISPISGGDENSTIYFEGNHSIFVVRFTGFATWSGRFSFTPMDVLPRAFSGIAVFVRCKSV